jgi:hypothetical protein
MQRRRGRPIKAAVFNPMRRQLMPRLRSILIAGAAALALAGSVGLAKAGPADRHVMTVQLPDGSLARIGYQGDVPPTVTLAPDAALAPVAFVASPFAMIERISREMDRAMGLLWHQVPFGPAADGRTWAVALPPGGGFCMRSVSVTSRGDGSQPQVVTHQAGTCGGAGVAPSVQQSPPDHGARTFEVKSTAPALLHRTGWHG